MNEMQFKEMMKYHSKMTEYKTKCKNCGHGMAIPPQLDKIICDWCGRYIFKDDKTEFKYRLLEKLKNK